MEIKKFFEITPPSDLREYVKFIYSHVAEFSEEDYDELTEFIRCLWMIRAEREHRTPKRLELLHVLNSRNQKKIFEEKQKLFAQLAAPEELSGSSPLRDSAESI